MLKCGTLGGFRLNEPDILICGRLRCGRDQWKLNALFIALIAFVTVFLAVLIAFEIAELTLVKIFIAVDFTELNAVDTDVFMLLTAVFTVFVALFQALEIAVLIEFTVFVTVVFILFHVVVTDVFMLVTVFVTVVFMFSQTVETVVLRFSTAFVTSVFNCSHPCFVVSTRFCPTSLILSQFWYKRTPAATIAAMTAIIGRNAPPRSGAKANSIPSPVMSLPPTISKGPTAAAIPAIFMMVCFVLSSSALNLSTHA